VSACRRHPQLAEGYGGGVTPQNARAATLVEPRRRRWAPPRVRSGRTVIRGLRCCAGGLSVRAPLRRA
jgi:hypothetical protein